MRDKFIFTDVHGCGLELERLIEPFHNCDLYSLGDNFDRAFHGVKVFEILRKHNVTCLLGNHELKLLQYLNGEKRWAPKHYYLFLHDLVDKHGAGAVDELRDFISAMPTLVNTDGMILVHGGIDVTNPTSPSLQCNVYGNFDPETRVDRDQDWWNAYNGDALVLYGHITHDAPLLKFNSSGKLNSIGLDTAACHGNSLTGLHISGDPKDGFKLTFHGIRTKDYFADLKKMTVQPFLVPPRE